MKSLISLIAILFAVTAWSGPIMIPGPVVKAVTSGTTYLVNQNFEGSGYDNSEAWTEFGTVYPDYTTTVLRGSQSLRLDGGTTSYIEFSFAAQTNASAHVMFRMTALPSVTRNLITFLDGSGNSALKVNITAGGLLQVQHGSSGTLATSSAMSIGTTYHIWGNYAKGTGADGVYSAGYSETTTQPTTTAGGFYRNSSSGNGTFSPSKIRIGHPSASGYEVFIDQIIVSTTAPIVPPL